MAECLLCSRTLRVHLTLEELFSFQKYQEPACCPSCLQEFSRIESASSCPGCSRQQEKPDVCKDCLKWQQVYPERQISHTALFVYEEQMKDWLHAYKVQGDIRLAHVFAADLRRHCRKNRKALLVPLPISEKSRKERGFNQCAELLREAGMDFCSLLGNSCCGGKQSEKNRQERLAAAQPFFLLEEAAAIEKEKEIILFDDVYTTGRTLLHAKELLFQNGFQNVSSVTLCR